MIRLILFTSSHCPGCIPMKKKVNNIVLETPNSITADFINVDESDDNLQMARAYYVSSTPTLLIEVDGRIMDTIIGNVPTEKILSSIFAVQS